MKNKWSKNKCCLKNQAKVFDLVSSLYLMDFLREHSKWNKENSNLFNKYETNNCSNKCLVSRFNLLKFLKSSVEWNQFSKKDCHWPKLNGFQKKKVYWNRLFKSTVLNHNLISTKARNRKWRTVGRRAKSENSKGLKDQTGDNLLIRQIWAMTKGIKQVTSHLKTRQPIRQCK